MVHFFVVQVFINCVVNNPQFNSQSKAKLVNEPSTLAPYVPSATFIKSICTDTDLLDLVAKKELTKVPCIHSHHGSNGLYYLHCFNNSTTLGNVMFVDTQYCCVTMSRCERAGAVIGRRRL